MATISENLQTIKDSTDAIKQAIIDKGGTIEGDITTWADAISGISGGGSSSDEEYVFTGTLSYSGSTVTITGSLNKNPGADTGRYYLLVLGLHSVMPSMLCYASHYIGSTDSFTLTVDFEDTDGPLTNEIPAICILNIMGNTQTIIPVKFQQTTPIKFYVNDIEYDALYPMTWEQFINSETYNPMLTDIAGYNYKQFTVKNSCYIGYAELYDGEYDIDNGIFEIDENGPKSPTITDIIKINGNYMC